MRRVHVVLSVSCVLVALTVSCNGQVFQDEVGEAAKENAPVFQDEIKRDGYHEVSPGVYAPSIEKPPAPPRQPFAFDDDTDLTESLRNAYAATVTEEHGVLLVRQFDEFVQKLMNPGGLPLYEEEEAEMDAAMKDFKGRQGLVPESGENKLYLGFVSRGSPFKFLKRLSASISSKREALRARYLKEGLAARVESVEGDKMAGTAQPNEGPNVMFEDEAPAPTAMFEDEWEN